MKKTTSKIFQFILDTLFPIKCLGCGKEGEWICSSCFSQLKFHSEQVCPYCQKNITPHGETCFACQKKYRLNGLFVAGFYADKLLQTTVHYYKYHFINNLHKPLGKFLLTAIHKQELPLPDLIIPVPLHPYRLRWRGFNQALLLAKFLSDNLSLHYPLLLENEILQRTRFTVPQMSLQQQKQRQKNIKNVFSIDAKKKKAIENKKIWLIDDVTTTGTTLKEAGKVLFKNGAQEVWGIVLARQGKER